MPFPIEGTSHALSIAYVGINDLYSLSPHPPYRGEHPFWWSYLDFVLSHELGHNLGVQHANAWECGPGIILEGPGCQHIEYGNNFDVMGNGITALHFNSSYKDKFRWFDDEDILTITQSGTYTINTLEGAKGVKAAKIRQPVLKQTPYYLEYRRAIGFDATLDDPPEVTENQNGLFVNWLVPGSPSFSRLLDMSPISSVFEDWVTVALLGKQIFSDALNGVRIGPVLSNDESSITFRVEIFPPPSQCVRRNPEPPVPEMSIPITPGGESSLGYGITNRDSLACSPSNFRTDVVVPTGWSYRLFRPEPIQVAPGAVQFNDLFVRAPSGAAPGTYTVMLRVTNLASGLSAESSVRFTIP
jgi:hypothetical protein